MKNTIKAICLFFFLLIVAVTFSVDVTVIGHAQQFTLPATGAPGTPQRVGGGKTSLVTLASNPAGTTSTTNRIAMGLGAAASPSVFTPVSSNRVLVIITGWMANTTLNDGGVLAIYFGTGAALTNGTIMPNPPSAFACSGDYNFTSAVATGTLPISLVCVADNLTIGTQYWFDVGLGAVTGGTAAISGAKTTIVEL